MHRADTVRIADVGAVTDARVDPDHYFLLRRHFGETVRFELPVSAVPDAKVVELTGNLAPKPVPATRAGDVWVVELPLTEGRYVWQWRVDGQVPGDQAMLAAAAAPPVPNARWGVKVVVRWSGWRRNTSDRDWSMQPSADGGQLLLS